MMNDEQNDFLQKASQYDLIAQFYKYTNPDLHIKFYKKHYKYIHLALQNQENLRNSNLHPFSHVRFINLLNRSIKILINGTEVFHDFQTNGLSDYFIMPTERNEIEIVPTGEESVLLKRQNLEISKSNYVTFAITETENGIDLLTFPTDQHLPEDETKLRIIHLANTAPAVDVKVKHGDTVFSNVSYGQATDYLGLTPMTVDLGLNVSNSKNTILPFTRLKLQANEIYSWIIVGDVAQKNGLKTILIKD
ncbi:DUF4397 domain-containing protein [Neobacillus sp. D3-1R]|uniref:DUF4397 domain-containing protein n=1 Tax=Neobacillus sp. D3-1R TaxID=3445778 RepID=UPI003F9FBAE7